MFRKGRVRDFASLLKSPHKTHTKTFGISNCTPFTSRILPIFSPVIKGLRFNKIKSKVFMMYSIAFICLLFRKKKFTCLGVISEMCRFSCGPSGHIKTYFYGPFLGPLDLLPWRVVGRSVCPSVNTCNSATKQWSDFFSKSVGIFLG